ncbi:MAG TPA: P-loop NTPase [Gaiellaceae bacterium]|nr:P-loop NTPase [Gaiellaceae bacterium]
MDLNTGSPLAPQSDLRGFVTLVRRQAVLIGVVAVLTAALSLGLSLLQADKYRSTARVLYTDPGAASGAIGGGDPARAVDTFVRLATTDDVLEPVAPAAGIATTDEVRKRVEVTATANANLLNVSAVASSPTGAANLANAVASALISWRNDNREQQFSARIASLAQQLAALAGKTSPSETAAASDLRTQLAEARAQLEAPDPELTLVNQAAAPSRPFSPRPTRNAIIGLIAGLFLGLGLAALRERFDRRLHGLDEIEQAYPWPLLGMVPAVSGNGRRNTNLVDFTRISALADAYRNIRTNLGLLSLDLADRKVWAISSAMPGEGKSAATANLANAFASAGLRVLALSADLHRPALHEYYGLNGKVRAGLIEVLAGEVKVADAARPVDAPGVTTRKGRVDLLANDRIFTDPAVLLQSSAMVDLLASARLAYDAIVIDCPPLLHTAEASLLDRLTDGLILVARLDHITHHEALRATRILETMQIKPVGVIVAGVKGDANAYGYGQAHTYGHAKD